MNDQVNDVNEQEEILEMETFEIESWMEDTKTIIA